MKKYIPVAIIITLAGLILVILGCYFPYEAASGKERKNMNSENTADAEYSSATFAGGCFWCMEPPFEKLDGVVEVISGYTGGSVEDPSYEEVSTGRTGHLEAIQVVFDPQKISYKYLLEVFWRQIDPTDAGGQFVDRGSQYGTAIFYHDEEQKRAAEESERELDKSGRFKKPVVTPIRPLEKFYPAEEYHQDFYKKSETHYKGYRLGSGRDAFINKAWSGCPIPRPEALNEKKNDKWNAFKLPDDSDLKKKLTQCQFDVTRNNGTERPFDNEYFDNKKAGIYVDVVSGEPLFSSKDKFDSGTGWPSFTKPIEPGHIEDKTDVSHGMERTEARSAVADSHLGHVFDDGPAPTGKRYCINSAALRFIPVENLEKEGYGKYRNMFE